MPNIYDEFPSKYLTAGDLKGKSWNLVIESVQKESMRSYAGAEPESKLVVFFEKSKKGLVLNKTNAFAIAEISGPETDAWKGKTVQLYPTKVQAFGDQVDAIRVREPAAIEDQPAELEQPTDTDEAPF